MVGQENISLPETRRRLISSRNLVSFDIHSVISLVDPFIKVPVKGLDDKTVIDIACGPQHSVALDSQGLVLSKFSDTSLKYSKLRVRVGLQRLLSAWTGQPTGCAHP